MYDFVNIVAGYDESVQDMGSFLGFAQVILRTADNDLMTVLDEIADTVLQGEQLGTTLYQGDAVHAETGLQGRHLEELVQDDPSIGIALDINDDTHTVAVALIIGIADAVNLLVRHQLGDIFNQLLLVHAIRDLRDDDFVVLLVGFDISLSTHDNAAAACLVSVPDALQAHDIGTCREVGTLHIHHQVVNGQVGIVHIGHASINYLAQVVRRYVCSHTHSDTRCAVDQQVGDAGRHYRRLEQCVVEVCGHVDGFLLQVVHHGLAHQGETSLGVTHGCRAVSVDGAEVSLTVDQRVAHAPFLSHTHQGAIYRAVSVRMVFTEHLTYDTCTLLVWLAM